MSDAALFRLPAREAVTRLCLELLAAARAQERRLDDPDAVDVLHDFRVAVRRLRSVLRSWRDLLGESVRPRDRRRLRRLQRATGAGRDAEVALAWLEARRERCGPEHRAGFDWLEQRLVAERGRTRERLDAELRAAFRSHAERLERHLVRGNAGEVAAAFGPALAAGASDAIETLVARLAQVRSRGDVAEMHAARIACKRLRYLVEPYAQACGAARPLVDACKALQTLLGDLNDAAVLGAAIDQALADSAAERAARVAELLRSGYGDRARREAWFTEWPGMIELARILGAERDDLFAKLQRDALEPGAEPWRELARALDRELRARVEGHAEIERKFLLRELPGMAEGTAQVVSIEQGWLPSSERLRALSDGSCTRYFRALKLGSGIERTEHEQEIEAELFDELWPVTAGCRLRKRRHRVRHGALVLEIDEFMDRDLALAEVELPAADAELVLPGWLSACVEREVTGESEFSGAALGR